MLILSYLLLFLLVAGLMIVVTARLHAPLNLTIDAVAAVIILATALKLFGVGLLTLSLLVWMIALVAGLYALRNYLRQR
ncbi:hypothetical protein [Lacticaseibacillus absianus]|uniref:hypothetical protein n=1 Tax=Lacticaseibacillus absianus TaxID=2729623 RepID=UPI0015C9F31D|nr:hypothetical protein [Lacticaseibacillus absianus]